MWVASDCARAFSLNTCVHTNSVVESPSIASRAVGEMSSEVVPPIAVAGVVVVGLASLPGVFAILTQIRSRAPKDNFYEDVDGKSTPESVAAFSNWRVKTAILVLSCLGFGLSVAAAVLATLNPAHGGSVLVNWLTCASWVGPSIFDADP